MSESNQALREMVSAVVDGEASEFECRRVIAGMPDPAVSGLIGRHFTMRSLVRQEAQLLCPAELSARIFDALEQESLPVAGVVADHRWRLRIGGAAVAASVCLLAVMGMQSLSTGGTSATGGSSTIASSGVNLGSLGQPAKRPLALAGGAQSLGLAHAVADGRGPVDSSGSDRLAEQRLRLFMADHAQNASLNTNQGMMPLARVASYQTP